MAMDDQGNWIPPRGLDYSFLAQETVRELEKSRAISQETHEHHHAWLDPFIKQEWDWFLEQMRGEYERKQKRRKLIDDRVIKPIITFASITGAGWLAMKLWVVFGEPVYNLILHIIDKGPPPS